MLEVKCIGNTVKIIKKIIYNNVQYKCFMYPVCFNLIHETHVFFPQNLLQCNTEVGHQNRHDHSNCKSV